MTSQQAGVSAEAVAKLVEKWQTISKLYGTPDAVRDAVYQQCADELKATLQMNADTPQCCCNVSWLDLDISDCPIHGPKAQPQAASAGALSAEELATRFHYLYEALAPQFGYETRKDSAVPWEKVPEKNRKLMSAVCEKLLPAALAAPAASKPEAASKRAEQ